MRVNRGSALLSALFIMTLVAIAATAMSTRLQLDIYRTHLTLVSDKLYLASQAVTFWSMDALTQKNKQFTVSDKDGRLMNYPAQLQHIYPETTLKGNLYDMQAFFNLNSLQNIKFHPVFFKLLENTFSKKDSAEFKLLINAIANWISPYQPERGDSSKDLDFYRGQKPPYLPSYQPMQSLSEFQLVRGVNPKIYQSLRPMLVVLPEITPININTASKRLLKSLGNGLNDEQLNELIKARHKNGIKNLRDIAPLLEKLDIPTDQITIESDYFLCEATVTSGDFSLTKYTLLQRSKDKTGHISVSIVSESINTM